jgi:hypothetical protein
MVTFVGEGYDRAFTENYRRIVTRLSGGEDILLASGPDDICAPLLDGPDPHCLRPSVDARDSAAAKSVSRLLGHTIAPGSTLLPDAVLLTNLRTAFADGSIRRACSSCAWDALCSRIASGCMRAFSSIPSNDREGSALENAVRRRG